MIRREEVKKLDAQYPLVDLIWEENGVEIDRIRLGYNLATSRQVKNGTEKYHIFRDTILVQGKDLFYLRREKNPGPNAVLSQSRDKQVIYAHLFAWFKYKQGALVRRNLFRFAEQQYLSKTIDDPVDALMDYMGYKV